MDFVNEQHVAFFKVREQAGKVTGFFDGGAAGGLEISAHRLGKNVGEGGFAEAGRAGKQDMIERFAALFGGGDGTKDAESVCACKGKAARQARLTGEIPKAEFTPSWLWVIVAIKFMAAN